MRDINEAKGKKRKKRKTRTPEHQASIDAKNARDARDAKAKAKFDKTVAGQSQTRLHQSGNTHIDVTHGGVRDAINRASKTWRGHPDHDKEVDKAAVGASTEQGGGDISRSAANRLSRQLYRGAEQTGGATVEKLRRDRPDQPRGTLPRREPDETNEAQTPLNPRTPRDPIVQAFRKRQKARLQRATHSDAPPIFPDPTVPMNPDLYEIRKSPEGPDKNRPVFKLPKFKKEKENVSKGKCATCGGGKGEFTDALSEKEHGISGMCQNCQDKVYGTEEPDDVDEATKEEMFPKLYDIPKLTKGLSAAQKIIWLKAMNKPSSARKEWRPPSTARKLARRLADSVLYERDERTRTGDQPAKLVKRPGIGGQPTAHLRTLKKVGGLTGSDTYRPLPAFATLTRTQPHRFIEKMSHLTAAWRSTKTGKGRQVAKNLAVAPRRGRQARKVFLKAQSAQNQKPKK